MKYIKTYERYTPTVSVTNRMKSGNYVSKYTDSDFKYKIGDFVKLLNKTHNREHIPYDDIYEIILRHIDKYGVEHYRLKKISGVPYYLYEFWQVEKNKKGEPMFIPLTPEEIEKIKLDKNIQKYNL